LRTDKQPLLRDIGILALVYHEWGPVWMTPHHVLTRLGRYFHVVWLEPPHGWREIRECVKKRQARSLDIDFSIPQGFQLYVPEPWLPKFDRLDSIDRLTFDLRLKRGILRLKREGCRKIVLYLWHPKFEAALDRPGFDLKLYHIDDEYSFSAAPMATDAGELRILSSVDQVFVVSPKLLECKGAINPHTAFMPEGVDYPLYATPSPEPDDMVRISHPRIGYTGNLKKQLDWPLLSDLAVRHPEWSFVFVGPPLWHQGVGEFIPKMSQLKNVHFLGPKSVTNLALYPQHFDICIMPYCVDEYTNNIYPLKLHEYLASGRPIVGSPIRSLRDFSKLIALAADTDDWSRALTAALEPVSTCQEAVFARQNIARKHDWENLIFSLARTICERLGQEYVEQFASLAITNDPRQPLAEESPVSLQIQKQLS
jgi:glycosyltransferase involved in cell wall biosynthesis